MDQKVRVLLVGTAFAGDLHLDSYSRIPDKAEIAGIVDKNLENIHELAQRYGLTNYKSYDNYEKALAEVDCDVVDICLPNFLHHRVCIAALERGRHVICEKPLATTVEDGRDMIETAKRVGKQIYYAEDWLCSPAVRRALEIIESGAIGDLNFVRARECHNGSHSIYAQTIEYCGGGSMIHLGVHPVCFMLALKNNRWSELVAMTTGGLENNLVHKHIEGEDWAAALLRFEDGVTAVIEANYLTHGGMEDVISFYGTKGCLHTDLTFSSPLKGFSIPGFDYTVEKADITTGWSNPVVDEKYNLGYVAEIAHFVECASKDKEARVGLRGIDGLETLEVIHLIYQSAREGVSIKNPKLERL